ncbi:MAG TPA: response regulator [Gemmataceae bacterium]|jgi:two-component system, cell cycle sensor histidine kinase and response regulator CckA|nr:response regulator [Gemmataceae bacterium]
MNACARTVLVVDANAGLVTLIEKYLRRAGFHAEHALNGADGLARLSAHTPDLLLLDLNPGDMTGEQFLHALADRGQAVPFVVITGHGEERRAVEMMKRGALDYLMKDGTLLELLPAVVAQALEQHDRRRLLREAEAAYEHLRRQYELILHAAGEGICGLDTEGRITFINPAALRMLGYEAHELLGQDLTTLAERPPAGANGKVRDALATDTTFYSHDQIFWRKDGSCLPIEYTTTPIRAERRQVGSVFVFKDVSRRRALEEQVRQSQKLEAVGRLAGGVAHDFNNLLTVVSGYGDVLARNPSLDDRGREAVTEIKNASERAINLARQLLAFSRKQLLRPQPLDLNAVVGEIRKLIRRLVGDRISLAMKLAPGVSPVTADSGQIEQVILNLAVNGRDAMPGGGTLTITTANVRVGPTEAANHPGLRPGRYALLTVTDTGRGMDEATQARAFEPFFTTKGPGEGTGLGLAVVHGIVAQSGGHIAVQSEPGRGTTFRVLLPQLDAPVVNGKTENDVAPAGGAETILLVDDEDAHRGLAAQALQSYGYQVLAARDGAEAQQIAQHNGRFLHLMVADLVMPGIGGAELACRLAPVRPKMKVLYLSASSDHAAPRGNPDRPAPLLKKPFTPESLARKVREVLDCRSAVE